MELKQKLEHGLTLLKQQYNLQQKLDGLEEMHEPRVKFYTDNNSMISLDGHIASELLKDAIMHTKDAITEVEAELQQYSVLMAPIVQPWYNYNVTLIACMSQNGVIGHNGIMPWGDKPVDGKHFYEATEGKVVVMGRKTFESVGLLKNRTNVILTKNDVIVTYDGNSHIYSCEPSVDAVLHRYGNQEIMVIGGAEAYNAFLPYARNIFLTVLDRDYEGDTMFPLFQDGDKWHKYYSHHHKTYSVEYWRRY